MRRSIFRFSRIGRTAKTRYTYLPFVPRVSLNFFPVLYFDFRIAGSRPAKCTTGRRTQLSSSNILEQTRATANKAFRFQRDSDQSNFGSWPAEQISRCECNLLFLTRKRGRKSAAIERLVIADDQVAIRAARRTNSPPYGKWRPRGAPPRNHPCVARSTL